MDTVGCGTSQGKAETCSGCRAQPDQGDERTPNAVAGQWQVYGHPIPCDYLAVRIFMFLFNHLTTLSESIERERDVKYSDEVDLPFKGQSILSLPLGFCARKP